jgi:hypothetical protein
MRELGRKGGSSRETALRKAVREDDEVFTKAKREMVRALSSKDEKRRFEAARSLFSFRAQAPPQERLEAELRYPGRGTFGIADLTRLAAELQVFSQLGGMTLEVEQELVKRIGEQSKRSYDRAPYPEGSTE